MKRMISGLLAAVACTAALVAGPVAQAAPGPRGAAAANGMIMDGVTFAQVSVSMAWYQGSGYEGWFYVSGTFNGQYHFIDQCIKNTTWITNPDGSTALTASGNITFNGVAAVVNIRVNATPNQTGSVAWTVKNMKGVTLWASGDSSNGAAVPVLGQVFVYPGLDATSGGV